MKSFGILALGLVFGGLIQGAEPARRPVLVELFTSEGCSDCPPADALLEKLDQAQPVPGAEIIVLSEHVDYWNHLGWSDPYSARLFSRRQESYVQLFRIQGPYTPQMVVDGVAEFVGSDAHSALSAIGSAVKRDKVKVQILRTGSQIHVEVEAGPHQGDVYLAVAQNSTSSHVLHGENKGRSLHHVAVVRRLDQIGKWTGRTPFAKDVAIGDPASGNRLIVFVQDAGSGRILGAAMASASRPVY